MNKRYLAAGIMLALAFALWFLTTIRADAVGSYQMSDLVLILVGLLLGIGAFPVSGDLNEMENESEKLEMNDKYDVTLDVTEQGLDGSYTSQPHTYRKCFPSVEAAQKGIEDLLWECVEIEGIASGNIFVEYSIEMDGEYVDHDECEIAVIVKRADKPSGYFVGNNVPAPMSVDRAKSYYVFL